MVNTSPYQIHKGYLVSQGTINNSFVIARYNPTQLLGVLQGETPPNTHGDVVTSGVTKVYVADSVQRGDQVRAIKSGDRGYQGQAVRVKTGDTDYFLVGEVLQSGTGLVDVSLRLQYVGSGNGNPQSSGLTDVLVTQDASYPLEYIQKVKDGQTSTVTAIVKPSGVVYGGNVSVQTGLTLTVRKAIYYILKDFYTSPETTVTLQPADPTYSRIDVIAGNTSGQVVVLTGVPSENPIKPVLDPDTQTEFTYVLIEAGATSPSGSLTELIYDENATGEWVCAGADSYSLKKPKNGFYCTELSNLTTGETFTYTKSGSVAIGNYSQLVLNLCLKAIMDSTQNIYVSLWNGSTQVGNEQPLVFDKSSLVYQLITVDVSKFGATGNITRVGFRHSNTTKRVGTHLGFYMDVIKLEAINTPIIDYVWHFGTTSGSGITQIPVTNGRRIHFAQGTNVTLEVQEHVTLGHLVTINATGGTQVQSDWAQSNNTDPSYIRNKPTIPAAQIQSDWNQSDTNALDFIKNKPEIPVKDDITFEYRDVDGTDNVYVLRLKSTYGFTINALTLIVDTGTIANIAVKINGTSVTGLSAVTATTTRTTTNATGANTVQVDDYVTITLGTKESSNKLLGELHITRT
jgi:hypothetical protein